LSLLFRPEKYWEDGYFDIIDETVFFPYSINIVNDSIIFTARKEKRIADENNIGKYIGKKYIDKEYRVGLTDEQQLKIKDMVSALNQKYKIPDSDRIGAPNVSWLCILTIDNQVHYVHGTCANTPDFRVGDYFPQMPKEMWILFRYIVDLSPIEIMKSGLRIARKNNPPPILTYQKGTFTDTRDGKIYKTTKIGEQVWMAENLNYEAKGSKCYNDSTAYCNKYGRLYNWETAMKACPNGWHLPSYDEWNVLMVAVGGEETAGKYLKATSGWNDYKGKSGNGTDAYGFTALPCGYGFPDSVFHYVGIGTWWSSCENYNFERNEFAYIKKMSYSYEDIRIFEYDYKDFFYSVRCLQDPAPPKEETK
jgi:uncharacterized protein (TIGR02145 family)